MENSFLQDQAVAEIDQTIHTVCESVNRQLGPLTLVEYQEMAVSTAIYDRQYAVTYPALGLVGEAGEVANKVKKVLRDDKGEVTEEKRRDLAAEIGDVLWYCAALAHDLGVQLADVAQENIDKLFSRKTRGTLQGSGDNR